MDDVDRLLAQHRAWTPGQVELIEALGPPDEQFGDEDNGLLLWHTPDPRPEPVLEIEAVKPEVRALAERLAGALADAVPAPADVIARHGAVVLLDGGRVVTLWDVHRLLAEGADAVGIAWNLLDQLQTDMAELTTSPWPGSGAFPPAGALVRDGRLEWWYGPEDDPVLALPPVDLPTD